MAEADAPVVRDPLVAGVRPARVHGLARPQELLASTGAAPAAYAKIALIPHIGSGV